MEQITNEMAFKEMEKQAVPAEYRAYMLPGLASYLRGNKEKTLQEAVAYLLGKVVEWEKLD